MGTVFGLKAFAVAILGGITSAWGVMLAGPAVRRGRGADHRAARLDLHADPHLRAGDRRARADAERPVRPRRGEEGMRYFSFLLVSDRFFSIAFVFTLLRQQLLRLRHGDAGAHRHRRHRPEHPARPRRARCPSATSASTPSAPTRWRSSPPRRSWTSGSRCRWRSRSSALVGAPARAAGAARARAPTSRWSPSPSASWSRTAPSNGTTLTGGQNGIMGVPPPQAFGTRVRRARRRAARHRAVRARWSSASGACRARPGARRCAR